MKKENLRGYEQREAQKKLKRDLEKKGMTPRERKESIREDRISKRKKKSRNREFARVTYFFVGLFLTMMGYIVYFNVVESRDIIRSPYNKRQDSFARRVIRGNIVDKNGNVLAKTSWDENGEEYREYPYANIFAHVVGYQSSGKAGIESIGNFELLTSNAFFLEQIKNELQNKKNMGDTLVTTLDARIQQAAYDALGGYKGAVVVMEPETGKILAMVSKPDFDPNTMAENWETLNGDTENSPLLNRATQGSYPPGSTFKIVTMLEYMREHSRYEEYSYDCTGEIYAGETAIHCYNGTVHGPLSLRDSLAYSCNASFSHMGTLLDLNQFRRTADGLLFNKKLPSEFPYSKSRFLLDSSSGEAGVMMTAMGQGETQVSPYHMALITCAAVNGGSLMKPYIVDCVTNDKGSVIEKKLPEKFGELMTAGESAVLKDYMYSVVQYGTAGVLNGQTYAAGGKTGTAEYSSDSGKDHSWFIGFAEYDQSQIAISVVIESSDGTGSAVDIAKAVFDSCVE